MPLPVGCEFPAAASTAEPDLLWFDAFNSLDQAAALFSGAATGLPGPPVVACQAIGTDSNGLTGRVGA